ncbi:MAG: hypothetical protein CUN53_08530 [Phototrophicales bacterium]|nr:MAG: hypothetical protein CUN53_08530 [Phototrophicales bacterium]
MPAEDDPMGSRLLLPLMALAALLMSACNLSSSSNATLQPLTQPAASRPVVTITAPRSGDIFPVNEEILISATATDAVGITRVQLIVNGQISKTVTANGETNFSALLDFIPRQPGTVNVQVIAYRSSVASDPAQIQLTIGQLTLVRTPSATPQIIVPTSVFPTANPANPLCRVRTVSNVNLRPGPGTNYNPVLTVIPSGTEIPIIGRLFDNTWWNIRFGSLNGWVSANVVQVLGNCFNIPVIAPPPPPTVPVTFQPPTITPTATQTVTPTLTVTPGLPDLLVTGLTIVGTPNLSLNLEGTPVSVTFSAVITNNGSSGTGQFTNSVLILPDEITQEIGVVGALGPGQSVVQEFTLNFTTAGQRTIQVRADSGGQVIEMSEVNNTGQINVTILPPAL